MAFDDAIVLIHDMKQRRHRLIVRDALRVGAFHDSAQLFGQADFAFLHHFVVADNVQFLPTLSAFV